MTFGIWNVRSLYRVSSLTAAADRESARYKLDLVCVQEVRLDKGGAVRAVDYNFFNAKENKIINWNRIFLHHRIVSVAKR
jgi:exonuclease III